MKKKVLSVLICAIAAVSQMTLIMPGVEAKAAANNAIETGILINQMDPDIIVNPEYTGEEGSRVRGIATYKSLGEAVSSVSASNTKEVKIFIKNGVYKEKLKISSPYITLIGESAENTILTYDDAAGTIKRAEDGGDGTATYGTSGSGSITVTEAAKNFCAANLTIENSFDEKLNSAIKNKQAVALKVEADESVFLNCRFIGNQDTLYPNKNRQYFYNCYIEGDVDFIFGGSSAVFENCEMKSVDREGINPKGYVAAPSTLESVKYGFLFLDSKLTSDIDTAGSVYLGRPWHPSSIKEPVISNAVYVNCELGSHIAKIGWSGMSCAGEWVESKNNDMFEYNNYGDGAVEDDNRPVLTEELADEYSKNNYLQGWNPEKKLNALYDYIEQIKNDDCENNSIPDVQVKTQVHGSTISQKYTITATDNTIDLSKLRIVFKADGLGTEKQNVFCDYAALQLKSAPWHVDLTNKIAGICEKGQVTIVINDESELEEGNGKFVMNIRISKEDYAKYDKLGDENVQVYYDGMLVQQ